MEGLRLAIQTRLGERMVSMSSTLVETVSINYEDFNESFLTCGTCLCLYDGGEHTLSLAHTLFVCTVCRGLLLLRLGTRGHSVVPSAGN